MIVTATEVRSYIHCPYKYRFKYISNIPLLKIKAKEHWSNCLKFVILEFMRIWVSKGTAPSLQHLQDRWNKAWFEDPIALDYETKTSQHDLGISGWRTLIKFYNIVIKETYIAAIEQGYKLEISKNLYLAGSIDILLYTNDPKLYPTNYLGIKLVDSNYYSNAMVGSNDIEMTAYRRAIKNILASNSPIPEPRLAYYVLDSRGEGLVVTRRSPEQDEVLNETVTAIAGALKESSFFPRFGGWCNACEYQPICDRGSWIKKDVSNLSFIKGIK